MDASDIHSIQLKLIFTAVAVSKIGKGISKYPYKLIFMIFGFDKSDESSYEGF